jgi:hypothetical protein
MPAQQDAEATLLDARTRYFERNGFGPDGGYSAKWVHVKLGVLPFAFPNVPSRVRAVRYHDLHHILTGYMTDTRGEAEIAAWELATNCRGFYAAWVLNFGSLAYGSLLCPLRVHAAFVRGRHTDNLYDRDFDDALLGRTVAQQRVELGLDRDTLEQPLPATLGDHLAFIGTSLFSLSLPLALLGGVTAGIFACLG